MSKASLYFLCFFGLFCASHEAKAQYFGNHALELPALGWMGFDTTAKFGANGNPWPMTDQGNVGINYRYAILDYKLWLLLQSGIGFGYANTDNAANQHQIVVTYIGSSGLRYNFMEEWLRPFIQVQMEYLRLFNTPTNAQGSSLNWLGFVCGPGLEWIFAPDMGIQIDTGLHALFDFSSPIRASWSTHLAYVMYF